ncbi:D-cysteine desulfhydrase family protein [Clostridium tagluense]|uniref:D-cysteine desulfhydrase family protein n=1 Tax=Clostridium tagluense TaxID=360422 RepID=UPI001CF103F7|nr:D-cysteine desulfhydrase family protein [Clostridium tagluense]MCB2311475.1 D-cysteine desulfhydrase family protein [Clostridium tagluense]MCB2316199.1 D-cysteine desulfhydrase family protein [Clostridium tagluense]MCB2320997.1 D-cysteine desulfhydrase family protein [Clostridium tagluense]MCB2326014.1 D-cysteine desulfhydrase family protein [Clostridium tagluense]MCB2330737.1 D-cysteine desulfhydrase family protein [Clostridium tagluense]
MIKIPEKIIFANLPTRIEKLERLSQKLGGPNIYIKRDDQTGTEVSGNKIRKLEFSVKEALNQGCDVLITCGGIQSNHCRATAAVASRLGMKSVLVLRGDSETELDGNLFIDKLLGAEIQFITPEEYKNSKAEIMEEIKAKLEKQGFKPYIIPEGASNGIGGFGYYNAMEEIICQEKEMGVHFDKIVLAVGSGGTHSGLLLASKTLEYTGEIYGINVCDDAQHFKNEIYKILQESMKYIDVNLHISKDEIHIMDGYVGRGYALSRPEELSFVHDFAKLEGIILDPVYTGKAMYGLVEEIKKGSFENCENILFIHTGGAFGLFPQKHLFKL